MDGNRIAEEYSRRLGVNFVTYEFNGHKYKIIEDNYGDIGNQIVEIDGKEYLE